MSDFTVEFVARAGIMPPCTIDAYPFVVPVVRRLGDELGERLWVAERVSFDDERVTYSIPKACEAWAEGGQWAGDWRLNDAGRLALMCIAAAPIPPIGFILPADAKLTAVAPEALDEAIEAATRAVFAEREAEAFGALLFVSAATGVPMWRIVLDRADAIALADGFRVVDALRDRHGWCVAVLTRSDAESTLGRELTEDEWDRLRMDRSWRRGDLFDDWPDRLDTILSLLDIEGPDE